jgi:hypothetical protein
MAKALIRTEWNDFKLKFSSLNDRATSLAKRENYFESFRFAINYVRRKPPDGD